MTRATSRSAAGLSITWSAIRSRSGPAAVTDASRSGPRSSVVTTCSANRLATMRSAAASARRESSAISSAEIVAADATRPPTRTRPNGISITQRSCRRREPWARTDACVATWCPHHPKHGSTPLPGAPERKSVVPVSRRRRVSVYALVTSGTLVAFLAIAAIWINRQVLETDNWTNTSSELLEDDDVRAAVGDFLVDQLYTQVDVAGELQTALPPRAAPLAGPAAGALRNLAERAADEALQRPRVQALWENANRTAHEQLLRVIKGGGDKISTEQGVVTLNLGVVLQDLAARTGIGGRVADKIPPDSAQITVLKSDQLSFGQDVANALKPLALVLTLLALALYGAAIAVGRGRRRETLRAAGWGFVVAGLLALVLRSVGENVVVDSLAKTESIRPAVEATWEIGTGLLVTVATAAIIYGLVTVFGAWLAGPTRAAVATRRGLAPYASEAAYAYGALVVFILLMIWWAPVPAARRLVPGLL